MRLPSTTLRTALFCSLLSLAALATAAEPPADTAAPAAEATSHGKLAAGQLPKLVLRWDCDKCEQNAKVLPLIEQGYATEAAAAGYTISDSETAELAITEYRQRPPGMRVMFGMMAGKDKLTTRVIFRGNTLVAKDYSLNVFQGMNSLCSAVSKKVTGQLLSSLKSN